MPGQHFFAEGGADMREPEEVKGFAGLVGREEIIAHLQNAIRSGKVSHAYIFAGEKGSGKRLMASLFAQTLECEEGGIEPCEQCASCRKMLEGHHPDVRYVVHEKPNSIGIDEIREQIVNDVQMRPYESRYKIYIVDEASSMTPQAQNALLKTIEEPPEYAVIILLADNPETLLQTIRSRCVQLELKPLSDEAVKDFLMTQMHVPDYQAEVEAAFAQGNIGKAKKVAESGDFIEMVQEALRLMKKSKELQVGEMVEAIRMLADKDRKQNIYDYLDIFLMWFRDVIMFKATREVDNLIFREEIRSIQDRAEVSSYEGLQEIIEAIQKAGERLKANVNFDLTMELMFLTIREN